MTMTVRNDPHGMYLLLGIKSGMTDKELLGGHWFGVGHEPIQPTAQELTEFRATEQTKLNDLTDLATS